MSYLRQQAPPRLLCLSSSSLLGGLGEDYLVDDLRSDAYIILAFG